jgi:adenosylmethionine-8-amino-7-oxononanoate aminotransferase
VRYIARHDLVVRCRAMGERQHECAAALRAHPHVGDVRGRGLLCGIELVLDRDTRRPFPRSAHVAERLADAAFDRGLLVWPNHGMANGADGDLVMLAPPYVITDAEIDELLARLALALDDTFANGAASIADHPQHPATSRLSS